MVSEKTATKAMRYLTEGHVSVKSVLMGGALYAEFHVRGSEPGDPYIVKFNSLGWHCDCPARVQECAHIIACETITDFEPKAVTWGADEELERILRS